MRDCSRWRQKKYERRYRRLYRGVDLVLTNISLLRLEKSEEIENLQVDADKIEQELEEGVSVLEDFYTNISDRVEDYVERKIWSSLEFSEDDFRKAIEEVREVKEERDTSYLSSQSREMLEEIEALSKVNLRGRRKGF